VLSASLTGRPPFQVETVLDTLTQVRGQEPESLWRTNPAVDRDLETICLKCLQKEPGRRYGSAEGLAEDLERWLVGEPVQARPISRAARAWRWSRCHKAVVGVATVLLLTVVVVTGGLAWVAQDRSTRRAVVAARVDEALRTVKKLRWEGRWSEALEVARNAAALVDNGPAEAELQAEVRALVTDLTLVEDLQEIRLLMSAGGRDLKALDSELGDRLYRDAFQKLYFP